MRSSRTARLLCAAILTGTLTAACGSSANTTTDPTADSAANTSKTVGSAQPHAAATSKPADHDLNDFCAGVRKLGLEQNTGAAQAAPTLDPALLPKLDALLPIAPPAISSDFALFVKVEHAVLGGGADPDAQQSLDNANTSSRLLHVSSYLQEHLRVG